MRGLADEKRSICIFLFILIAATFLFYSGSLSNEFVWDDNTFIVNNPYIHDASNWPKVFTHNMGFSSGARNNSYRPLFSLLNMLNYETGGARPLAFHITNILLHAVSAVLVMLLLYLIAGNLLIAFGAAFLFALHPVQTQAVTYISGRADPMYVLFSLASVICLLYYLRERKNTLIYILSIVFLAPAFLSKETAIITPFLMLLSVYAVSGGAGNRLRDRIGYLIPHFVMLSLYLAIRLTALNFSKTAYATLVLPTDPFNVRILTACKAVFFYFRYLFFPIGFQMEAHLDKSFSIAEQSALFAVIGIIIICAAIFRIRKNRILTFGPLWFFIGLLPVLNLFPINAVVAIHWLYLPSIGFFFNVCYLLWRILPGRKTYMAVILIAGLALGSLTYMKNMEWKDEETLYTSILPHSQTPRVYVNLGNIYVRRQEYDKAVTCYQKALKIAPGQTEAYVNLGYIYNNKGDFNKAREVLKEAIRISPRHANAYFNLAVTYANMGKYDDALRELNKALEMNPNHTMALNLIGDMHLRSGNSGEAKKAFERSLQIKKDQPEIEGNVRRLTK